MSEQSYSTQLAIFLDTVGAFERTQGLPENSLRSLVLTGIEIVEDTEPITISELMDMDLPTATPTIGHIDGIETPLFYQSALNLVFGPPGDGKTMLMQYVALNEVQRGRKVLWLDAEEAVWNGVKQRWSALLEDVPDGLWLTLLDKFPARKRDKLVEFVVANDIDLVVLDSFGEFLGKTGRKEIDDGDIQSAYDFLMPFAQVGAAVVIIDHPPKANRYSASGSKRKMARPWVTYGTNTDTDDSTDRSFSINQAGFMRLTCIRDRYGARANGSVAARMDVIPSDGHTFVTLRANYEEIDEMVDDLPKPQPEPRTKETTETKLRAYMADGSMVTKTRVKEVCGFTNLTQVDEFIGKMIRQGVIEAAFGTGKSRTYRLTSSHVTSQ